jgi:hypothetical protein
LRKSGAGCLSSAAGAPQTCLRRLRPGIDEWIQTKVDDGTFECVYAFPEGGGCSIGQNDSHEQLMEQLMDYPLSPFVDYEVHPLVELDAAFQRFIPFVERMTEQMAAAG